MKEITFRYNVQQNVQIAEMGPSKLKLWLNLTWKVAYTSHY